MDTKNLSIISEKIERINFANNQIKAFNAQILKDLLSLSEALLRLTEEDRSRLELLIKNDLIEMNIRSNTIPGIK